VISFKACKYLIFDRERIDPRCKIREIPEGLGAYWERPKELLPDQNCAADVQFCSLRGRINGKQLCLKGMAMCDMYEEATQRVEIIKETER